MTPLRSTTGILTAALLALACVSAAPAPAPQDAAPKLQKYNSRYYTVYTNLSVEDAKPFVLHMDATFAAYKRLFSTFHSRDTEEFPLYLFDTHENYQAFLASLNFRDVAYTGGIFFVDPRSKTKGLATFTQASKPTERADRPWIFHTLQHEGFHQFAYAYIGTALPLWVNEGLAEYFGNGVLVNDQLYLGSAPAAAIAAVRDAITKKTALDFDRLIAMTPDQWRKAMSDRPDHGSLLYQQSWSIVHFLIHGDNGKYKDAFDKYLRRLSEGRDSAASFREAFGSADTAPFRARWEEYVLQQLKPDPLSTAVSNLEVLGLGLETLARQKIPLPRNFPDLKRTLKQGRFTVTRTLDRTVTKITADDNSLYEYTTLSGRTAQFELLSAENGLLPRLTAPGMKPVPTLTWRRDSNGQVVQEVTFQD